LNKQDYVSKINGILNAHGSEWNLKLLAYLLENGDGDLLPWLEIDIEDQLDDRMEKESRFTVAHSLDSDVFVVLADTEEGLQEGVELVKNDWVRQGLHSSSPHGAQLLKDYKDRESEIA